LCKTYSHPDKILLPNNDLESRLDEEIRKKQIIQEKINSDNIKSLAEVLSTDLDSLISSDKAPLQNLFGSINRQSPKKREQTGAFKHFSIHGVLEDELKETQQPSQIKNEDMSPQSLHGNGDELLCDEEEIGIPTLEQKMKSNSGDKVITEYNIRSYYLMKRFIHVLSSFGESLSANPDRSSTLP
jgi:hypothetical protein